MSIFLLFNLDWPWAGPKERLAFTS